MLPLGPLGLFLSSSVACNAGASQSSCQPSELATIFQRRRIHSLEQEAGPTAAITNKHFAITNCQSPNKFGAKAQSKAHSVEYSVFAQGIGSIGSSPGCCLCANPKDLCARCLSQLQTYFQVICPQEREDQAGKTEGPQVNRCQSDILRTLSQFPLSRVQVTDRDSKVFHHPSNKQ